MCPNDPDAYFDEPDFFTPKYEEAHISCTFTWDIEKAKELAKAWGNHAKVIKVGGPAFETPADDFQAGLYLRQGVTITSRGCPNNCDFCLVPKREGKIKTLPIVAGHIVQDNNLLACPDSHLKKVWAMLRKQHSIEFRGGFEISRITPKVLEELRSLRIREIWIACDRPQALKKVLKAIDRLHKAGFSRHKIHCYVIIGKDMEEERGRMKDIFLAGAMPFAQLRMPLEGKKTRYSRQWRRFQRIWCRPALIEWEMKK
jgi:hypothetical protein